MDGFISIQWDTTADETSSFFYKKTFIDHSGAVHKICDRNQSPWPIDEKPSATCTMGVEDLNAVRWKPENLKREKINGAGLQGKVIKIVPPKPFPRKSVLTVRQQKDYLFAIIRVMKCYSANLPHDPVDAKVIEETQIRLKNESQEFQKMAQTIMFQNPSAYNRLDQGIAKYVAEAWKTQLQSITTYPRFYKLNGGVTLLPKENVKTIELVLDKTVLEMGRIPSQIFFSINSTKRLSRAYKAINNCFPADQSDFDPISRDTNAIRIAQKYDVDIIVSSTTMKTLAGNVAPLFKQKWEIPFSVQELPGDMTRKRIFIDDPLPPKEMTAIEKNVFFNTRAVKYEFTNFVNKSRYYTLSGSQQLNQAREKLLEPLIKKPVDVFDEVTDLSSLETFGVEQSKEPNSIQPSASESGSGHNEKEVNNESQIKSVSNSEKEDPDISDDDSDSEASLVIDLDGGTPTKQTKTEPIQKAKTSQNDSTNLLNSILQDQEKLLTTQRNSASRKESKVDRVTLNNDPEDPAEYTPPQYKKNVTYRIHTFRVNQRSLRLLVRSSVDTAVTTANNDFQTFIMVSKTEYQPWYGSECITPREINEQWMDTYLRPESKIFCVRLDAYTGDFIMMDQKRAACLATEANFRSGDPHFTSKCLQSVWAVLSSLYDRDLPAGSYLLQHGIHDGISVQVMNSTDQSQQAYYDLHQEYSIDTNATAARDVSENWVALDPWTVLPVQRSLNRPPLTFEPTDSDESGPAKRKNVPVQQTKNQKKFKKANIPAKTKTSS